MVETGDLILHSVARGPVSLPPRAPAEREAPPASSQLCGVGAVVRVVQQLAALLRHVQLGVGDSRAVSIQL